jgi:hypothetical protein
MLGFETIGNATVIAYDGDPIIATDPWINGDAYFGSWGLSHRIPAAQYEAIQKAKFIWFSHGHPDHVNIGSLADLGGKQILLADHYGSRIRDDLTAMGFNVRVLPQREWVTLSPRLRIFTMADENQDSILLLDVGGRLIVNLNDASPKIGERVIRPIAQTYQHSYLMRLWGYGDADMINFFGEDGERLPYSRQRDSGTLCAWVRADAIRYRTRYAIPFSSFHRYQRTDSIWANSRTTPLQDFCVTSDPQKPQILPAFLRVDSETGEHQPINPPSAEDIIRSPEEFGDRWEDPLESSDKAALRAYFQAKEALFDRFGFIRFRVGGVDTTIDLNRRLRQAGITFEVPRTSLMTAVEYRVFDDLLIGNFMKTTLHGDAALYPGFSPFVSKYADNGGVQSKKELRVYFHHYRSQDPFGYAMKNLEASSEDLVRKVVADNSIIFKAAKKLYWTIKGA